MASKRIPTDPEQRWEWVKYMLRINKSSLTALARENGNVSRQAPQQACYFRSPKWEAIIAAKIGRSPREIWPERYAA